jgi:hypothetical protein
MKHRWSKPQHKVSEFEIAFYYTVTVYGIFFLSKLSVEDIIGVKILLPVTTIAAGYFAIYLTFRFIRQVTEKRGK